MGDARPDTVNAAVGRLKATLDTEAGTDDAGIAPAAVAEVRSAIELLHGGQSCAAVSALLAARAPRGPRGSVRRCACGPTDLVVQALVVQAL